MYAVLIFPGGGRADAILLSAKEDRLRFAIAGRGDVTELQMNDGRWLGENGELVELGALIATEKDRRT
jgi:hypothetical protein